MPNFPRQILCAIYLGGVGFVVAVINAFFLFIAHDVLSDNPNNGPLYLLISSAPGLTLGVFLALALSRPPIQYDLSWRVKQDLIYMSAISYIAAFSSVGLFMLYAPILVYGLPPFTTIASYIFPPKEDCGALRMLVIPGLVGGFIFSLAFASILKPMRVRWTIILPVFVSITLATLLGYSEGCGLRLIDQMNQAPYLFFFKIWGVWQTIMCGYFGFLIDRHQKAGQAMG